VGVSALLASISVKKESEVIATEALAVNSGSVVPAVTVMAVPAVKVT